MERLGLETKNGQFFIDGQPTRLISGALHYFRVVPEYWEDRLSSLRASGLNAVETYVPWNLHEELRGQFNFSGMLDVRRFIQTAQKIGLFVIFRPGPYICSEWDFGGLPSWLLTDPDMQVRSSYKPYLDAVASYFSHLLPLVADLQYTRGGPIIAVQIENEYGSYSDDKGYLNFLKDLMLRLGVVETLFTSDNEEGIEKGCLPPVLMTANFQTLDVGQKLLAILRQKQPNAPSMVMEFWSGWFDHWGEEKHNSWPLAEFEKVLAFILSEYGNVNVYMFHGGTNFGFMNGANEQLRNVKDYQADVTSYDYDALLNESGATTAKYAKLKELVAPYTAELEYLSPGGDMVSRPLSTTGKAYGHIKMSGLILLADLINSAPKLHLPQAPPSMEALPGYNGGNGQGYGFLVYRKVLCPAGTLTLTGRVRDRAVIFLNDIEVGVIECNQRDAVVEIPGAGTLDILVENMGRVNYAPFQSPILNDQRKGLVEPVLLDSVPLIDWQAFPLEFKAEFVNRTTSSGVASASGCAQSCGLRTGSLNIDDELPHDTYLQLDGWTKGVVFINGFNLGRYWSVGPTRTLYIPGPLLVKGQNQVAIFELHSSTDTVNSVSEPLL